MNKQRMKEIVGKAQTTLKEEGITGLAKKSAKYVGFKVSAITRKYDQGFKDVLFINGCSLPHPQRYRVDHQIEQLESYNISCDRVDYERLNLDLIKYYRAFVFYRCPIIPVVEEFIKIAKENNKTIFYDIDDLVFDLEYTNKIKYLDTMSKDERELYDDGVVRMGKTLDLCEYGIASTERLQTEMGKHLQDVYVNHNVASEEMTKYSKIALDKVVKDQDKIIIGYLSGTITHNDDFKLIMPSVIKVLEEYDDVYLQIVGLLDLPAEMAKVQDKVITSPFVDWQELPKLIRSIDINLAPLENTIFNEAKSENKWTEASLVKIPTIASNVGAFSSVIENGKTGVLCNDDEWYEGLKKLIEDKSYRKRLGDNAYNEVMNHHITTNTGKGVAEFIKSKLRPNIAFVLPSTNVSGGTMVAIKHGIILKKHGYDVTMFNINKDTKKVGVVTDKDDYVFVVSTIKTELLAYLDTVVATMWLTLEYARKYYNAKNIKYLVQNRESGFYSPGKCELRRANSTYSQVLGVSYITISKWCQEWLEKDFGNQVRYAPNGIDLSLFPKVKRAFKGKIKILIEGNSKDIYKNVDESFQIVEKLDKEKYEIHYLSYGNEPKSWYRVDKFYHKIPHDEVGKIYSECDILIKTSVLESFSYPPLEMMATGGVCVVRPNEGNSEYIKDEYNCLTYEGGNIDDAVLKIKEIVNNKALRDKLIKNGLKTAEERRWETIEQDILALYEE